ncbi:macro domain-like protein [Fistulina hepatica ATCC 64428]|nr:macro domain-like protein [Fistulina hepatica ATCC 64428]
MSFSGSEVDRAPEIDLEPSSDSHEAIEVSDEFSEGSDPDSEVLIRNNFSDLIELSDIPTIAHSYHKRNLAASDAPRYPPNESYLKRVSLFQGDITKLKVDCIVNAANRSLLGLSFDGAIHRAAGPDLLDECATLGGAKTGEAKITKGYRLPSLHVIHAVGPVYSRSHVMEKAVQLASCYNLSLEITVENSLKHVAFPSISTGVYGYPIEDATHVALNEVRTFLDSHPEALDRVIFVVFSDKDKSVYEQLIPLYFPPA